MSMYLLAIFNWFFGRDLATSPIKFDSHGGFLDMKNKFAAFVTGVALFASTPLMAHHPFDTDYDRNKFVTLTGIVTRVEWVNPHAMVHMNVKAPDGRNVTWTLELGGMDDLTKEGWTRDSLKVGDQVTAEAWLAKDGSRRANAESIMLSRKLTTHSSAGVKSDVQRSKPSGQQQQQPE
jgi:hypothetical protein